MLTSPTDTPVTELHLFPVLPDQFVDAAYSPLLLPNHDAGAGRGARLELLDDDGAPPTPAVATLAAPPDTTASTDVDHTCMPHARGSAGMPASPGLAAPVASTPGLAPPRPGPLGRWPRRSRMHACPMHVGSLKRPCRPVRSCRPVHLCRLVPRRHPRLAILRRQLQVRCCA